MLSRDNFKTKCHESDEAVHLESNFYGNIKLWWSSLNLFISFPKDLFIIWCLSGCVNFKFNSNTHRGFAYVKWYTPCWLRSNTPKGPSVVLVQTQENKIAEMDSRLTKHYSNKDITELGTNPLHSIKLTKSEFEAVQTEPRSKPDRIFEAYRTEPRGWPNWTSETG